MKKDTRKQFVNSLIKRARKEKDIWLLTGDLGYSFIEPFAEEFPDRFINVGIAEQNMIGLATGLALMGKKPYCYSNAVFINYKCAEQIRNAFYQGIRIKVIGTGAADFLGFTHNLQPGEKEPLKQFKGYYKKI
jgi:transketolase